MNYNNNDIALQGFVNDIKTIMDGWFIYNASGYNHCCDIQTITHDTEIALFLNQEIKFDVTIEDC